MDLVNSSENSLLTNLPTGVIIFHILPLLDYFSLAKVSLTCVTLRKTVSDFLATNRVLDMKPVFQKLGNDYPKLKMSLMFLTNNLSVSSLREFRYTRAVASMTRVEIYSLYVLDPIRKLLLVNKELETLTIEMRIYGKLVDFITQLPKLKYLKITNDKSGAYRCWRGDRGEWIGDRLENLERSGCVIEEEG